jgi:hypothetical protein
LKIPTAFLRFRSPVSSVCFPAESWPSPRHGHCHGPERAEFLDLVARLLAGVGASSG